VTALAEIAELMDARANTPGGDRLDVLVTLVEAYEEKHWRVNPPDPIEAIKLRMQQRGLSRSDLEKVLGSKSRVSEVLNRKRPLTIETSGSPTRSARRSRPGSRCKSIGSSSNVGSRRPKPEQFAASSSRTSPA
jgi:antitoxin component HigA of HigAB toxin-antitoxin module